MTMRIPKAMAYCHSEGILSTLRFMATPRMNPEMAPPGMLSTPPMMTEIAAIRTAIVPM